MPDGAVLSLPMLTSNMNILALPVHMSEFKYCVLLAGAEQITSDQQNRDVQVLLLTERSAWPHV